VGNPWGLSDPLSLAETLVINVAGLVATIGNAVGESASTCAGIPAAFGTSSGSADSVSASSVSIPAPITGDEVETSFRGEFGAACNGATKHIDALRRRHEVISLRVVIVFIGLWFLYLSAV
jgi:hypothetical protein